MQNVLARLLGLRKRLGQPAVSTDGLAEFRLDINSPATETTHSHGTTERAFFDGDVMIWETWIRGQTAAA